MCIRDMDSLRNACFVDACGDHRDLHGVGRRQLQTCIIDSDEQLNGTTSLAIAADPVAPARVIAEFAKKLNGRFEIKGGFLEGKVVPLETVNALASIPALPILQAQVLGTMLAPISALACVIKQIAEKQGAPAEEAAAEAPAAE